MTSGITSSKLPVVWDLDAFFPTPLTSDLWTSLFYPITRIVPFVLEFRALQILPSTADSNMADPLSIAASIAGVVTLADIVFIRISKYLKSAKNADKDVRELSKQVLLLDGALHSLSKLAQAVDTEGIKDQHIDSLRMHHIAACHTLLDEVGKKLKKFEDSSIKKFTWPFASDRTKSLLDEISRHREIVNLALSADSMGALLRILSENREADKTMKETLEEAKRTREIVTRIDQNSERKEVVNSFLTYNPQQNYETSLALRHPRTGLWLPLKLEFQTWLAKPDTALWLSGIPGAGKTVLAGVVIEEVLKRSTGDIATAFFFCDYKNVTTQKAVNVLSTLASQLAIQKEEAYGHLERYYRELHPERSLPKSQNVEGLQRVLKDMMKSFDHVFLVVDGLDECGDDTDSVIDSILDILDDADNISTAFLSRDEDNIRNRLEENFTGVEIAAHTEDITEYVTSEIENRLSKRTLRIEDLSLKGEILEGLINGAKGMFRWVACQLDFLEDCVSDKECREALGHLPPGLDDSYIRILQRVPQKQQLLVQMMLNFIAYAKPRLEIPLLRQALSVPEVVGSHDALDSQSLIREDTITKLCRSLVRKTNDGAYYEFAHFSVEEFLEGQLMYKPELEHFRVSQSICKTLLAKQCINYLLFRDFSSLPSQEDELIEHIQMRDEKHPFYLYAAANWPIFARDNWEDENLIKSAKLLFLPFKSGNFTSWALEMLLLADAELFSHERWDSLSDVMELAPGLADRNFTPLHMAAAMSLPVICSTLLDQGASIDLESCFGSPLQCAVQGLLFREIENSELENFELLQVGLQEYREYFVPSSSWREPQYPSIDVVKLLLDAGATHMKVCSGPFFGHTLLTVACRAAFVTHDVDIVAALLEAGVVPEEDDLVEFENTTRCLISIDVSLYGLERLIRCLGPMINKSTAYLRLCQAAWSFAIETGYAFAEDDLLVDTRILLSKETLASSILEQIKCADTESLARVLRDPRARDLIDPRSGTAFSEALDILIKRPSEGLAVIQTMVAAGMEVEQPDQKGNLPLHSVAECMWIAMSYPRQYETLWKVVSEFIARGPGCNARSRKNKNVFHHGHGSLDFIKAVLEIETENNILPALKVRDEKGYTPISSALETGSEDVALILMETSNFDPETMKGPIDILATCVKSNAQRAFDAIREAWNDPIGIGTDGATPLHEVGWKTSKGFTTHLMVLFPHAVSTRVNGKLPLDKYLESCILFGHDKSLDPAVVHILSSCPSEQLSCKEKGLVWEAFINIVTWRPSITENLRPNHRPHLNATITKATAILVDLGFMQSYEQSAEVPGLLPLSNLTHHHDCNPWRFPAEATCQMLKATSLWEEFCNSPVMLRILKRAVIFNDVLTVELLLSKGANVHQRIDGISALEKACERPSKNADAKAIFTLLLNHEEEARLNEINPDPREDKALIHYLAGYYKEWQLEQLLERRVDINVRTGTKTRTQPALVQHLLRRSPKSALTLLKCGANPTLADTDGFDAALAAAFEGNLTFLLQLLTTTSDEWQVDWERTCDFTGLHHVKLCVSEANALHISAWRGDLDVLRFYIDNKLLTDLNATSRERFTPLHLAAAKGQIGAVKLLYSHGASLNPKARDGSGPLHMAVRNKCAEVVKFLVANGSLLDDDIHGMSPVAYAMEMRDEAIIDCLCESQQYEDYQSLSEQVTKDLAYLYEQALIRGDIEQCEELHGQGCPVNITLPHQYGRSALLLAIKQIDDKLAEWLLDHCAETTEKLNAQGQVISTLQAMIAQPDLNHVLPLFLQEYQRQGGLVAAERPSSICMATFHGNNVALRLLLEHIARYECTHTAHDTSISAIGEFVLSQHILNGWAPLHWAARRGNCEAIKLLVDYGADINAHDPWQSTPLQIAINWEPADDSPAAKLLLSYYGTTIESRDDHGASAVMLASRKGKLELIRLLSRAGADLNSADFEGWTSLHLAAFNGHLETFTWLLRRGLQLQRKNAQGFSAGHYAMFRSNFTSFILNCGSIIDDVDAFTYAQIGNGMNIRPAWLGYHFKLYLRRLGTVRLRALANLEPSNSWSPLCISASLDYTLAVANLLQLGAQIDFEGSPYGSALMAACSGGRLGSVKILIRHGASISYLGADGIRSAVGLARNHKAIRDWLLVGRFMDQKKLSDSGEAGLSGNSAGDVKPWSGIGQAELTITGISERQAHESAMAYWTRLKTLKKKWRGKVVPVKSTAKTHRPSRLIPEEPVRICPGYYGVSDE